MSSEFRIPILTYHSIDDSGSIVSVKPATFREQMERLCKAGYISVTLGEFVRRQLQNEEISEKTIILTFDDGFENFLTDAFPILRDCSFSATVFLVTDQCGHYNDWSGNPPRLRRSRLLSWTQVKEMAPYGIEFGSHTKTHPDLTKLSEGEAALEITDSRRRIEDQIGKKVTTFAYPFGANDRAIREAVGQSYFGACTTELGKVTNESDLCSLQRIDAYYLSGGRAVDILETRRMDTYLAARQLLRTVRRTVAFL
jgi:peptidoglycan/xylan/chitin deacetylase (PgdA/CDA1 family)